MMDIPGIHQCSHLSFENEKMRRKLKKLKKINKNLEKELSAFEEKSRLEKILHLYITTRESSTQTEQTGRVPLRFPAPKKVKKEEKVKEDGDASRLLSLHDKLMRRYEKEVRTNTQHLETISSLMLKINGLEQDLQRAEQQNKKSRNTPTPRKKGRRRKQLDDSLDLRSELETVKKERDHVLKQKKKLASELKGLDEGFFEEIEDLKFALHESAKLNKEYERALQKMCTQFGVPFPFTNGKRKQSPYRRNSTREEMKENKRPSPYRTSTRTSHRPGSW